VVATFSGEQYGSFTYHFDTPQDFTGGRVFFPFHVENVAGPVWFSVYVLSGPEGAYSSTSRAYFETIPAEGSALQVDLATMTSEPPEVDPAHIIELGLQFGAGGWDPAGVLEFYVDEVRVER
jgi:hypothetical protein